MSEGNLNQQQGQQALSQIGVIEIGQARLLVQRAAGNISDALIAAELSKISASLHNLVERCACAQ